MNIKCRHNQKTKYYKKYKIEVKDIGAVSFFNDSKIIDLWGLANMQVAKAKKNNYNTPAFLTTVADNEHVNNAIVYDSWFDSLLLNNWQKVATWQIENNVICGDATVSFYAVQQNSDADLKNNLFAYQQKLPKDVTVKYY